MKKLEQEILIGCCVDLLHNQQQQPPSGYGYTAEKRRWHDTQAGRVKCNPSAWADCDLADPAQRMAVSRAYKGLESRGLIVRIADNERSTTHLEPTSTGLKLAAELTARETTANG